MVKLLSEEAIATAVSSSSERHHPLSLDSESKGRGEAGIIGRTSARGK
jgi:hypothetical protein